MTVYVLKEIPYEKNNKTINLDKIKGNIVILPEATDEEVKEANKVFFYKYDTEKNREFAYMNLMDIIKKSIRE